MYVTLWPAQYVSVSFKVKWIAVINMLVYQCIVSTQTSFVNFLFWDIFFCSEVFCWCEEIHIFVCDCTQVHTQRLEAASFQNLETLVLTLHTWRRLAIYYFVSAFHKTTFYYFSFQVIFVWALEIVHSLDMIGQTHCPKYHHLEALDCQTATRWVIDGQGHADLGLTISISNFYAMGQNLN